MVYTYVIRSRKDNKLYPVRSGAPRRGTSNGVYTGTTTDLLKRFREHNEGNVTSTKNRGPFELIYYESCANKEDAFTRERYLKTGVGKRYLHNRLKRFLSLTGHAGVIQW